MDVFHIIFQIETWLSSDDETDFILKRCTNNSLYCFKHINRLAKSGEGFAVITKKSYGPV